MKTSRLTVVVAVFLVIAARGFAGNQVSSADRPPVLMVRQTPNIVTSPDLLSAHAQQSTVITPAPVFTDSQYPGGDSCDALAPRSRWLIDAIKRRLKSSPQVR